MTLAVGWSTASGADDLIPISAKPRGDDSRDASQGFLPAPVDDPIDPRDWQDSGRIPETIEPREVDAPELGNWHDGTGVGESANGGLTDRVEVILQRYPDGKVQIKRHVVQDEEGNYLSHGPWQLFNRQGQVLAEGSFEFGLMEGSWQRWHAAQASQLLADAPFPRFSPPFLSVAEFRQGKLHGSWTIKDRLGRTVLTIPYDNGQRHGTAVWYWPTGEKMRQITFNRGQIDGPLAEWDEQGRQTRTEFYESGHRLVRHVSFWRQQQLQSEDHYRDAELVVVADDDWWNANPASYQVQGQQTREGITQAWYENGQPKMRGQYRNDVRDGEFTWWHANGMKQLAGRYANGQKVGPWTWWHENGTRAIEGSFQEDHPVGRWTWWDEAGQLMDEQDFSDGLPELIGPDDGDWLDQEQPVPADDDALPLSPPSPQQNQGAGST